MSEIVKVKKNDVFTDSIIIAEGTGYEHHTITRKIRDFFSDFEELGKVKFVDDTSINPTGGRPTRTYLLNEPQASYLMTLLENNEVVRRFKLNLVKEFFRMRSFLIERQSAEWQQARITGKQTRKDETDIILTKLIPLAELQGSSNPEKLYMTYSKLINSVMGIKAGERNNLTLHQVETIKFLERAIENIISLEVDKGTNYKEIYQICKVKCNVVKELAFLPQARIA